MFNSLEQFEQEAKEVMEKLNKTQKYEVEFFQSQNQLLSEEKVFKIQTALTQNYHLKVFLLYNGQQNFCKTYFQIIDFQTGMLKKPEEISEILNPKILDKVEQQMNRYDLTFNLWVVKTSCYRLNDCGLRLQYQDMQKSNNHINIMRWLSMVFDYFNIYFTHEEFFNQNTKF